MVTKMELKKIILASAVASVITGSAAHADMSLQIGGNIDAQIGFRNEDSAFERVKPFDTAGDKRRGEAIVHDTTLTFEVFGHTDILGGLNYGGKIVLEADTSSSKYHMPDVEISLADNEVATSKNIESVQIKDPAYNLNRNAREVMVFFDGDWGHLEAGNTYGATKKMQIDAGSVAAGNGGVHGDSGLWINPYPLWGNMRTPDFYTNKMAFYHVDHLFLPANQSGGTGSQGMPFSTELATAAKISYYSPNFNGLRFGVTYIPDTDVYGTVSNIATVVEQSSAHGFGFEDVFEGGFLYDGSLGDIGFQLSVLGQTGDAKKRSANTYTTSNDDSSIVSKYEDIGGYEIGLATSFMGIGFAASYGEHDGLLSNLNDLEYYTLGLGYEMGPWAFSVNYMKTEQESKVLGNAAADTTFDKKKKAEFENLVFDVAYQCQGMMPYLQVASFEAIRPENGQDTNIKNDGTVVLVGAKISF